MSQQGTRVLGRERVTYVMGILGNRDGPRATGGDVLCVHDHRIFGCYESAPNHREVCWRGGRNEQASPCNQPTRRLDVVNSCHEACADTLRVLVVEMINS